ncbi:MAG: glycosyltransferase family 2 protein [Bacilli bacterium]|nr:glycosyltransferase family 2 protein [Bacilli bacterium]
MKKVGMIIVNYNDSETTIKLLNNVKDYELIDKIVIVDNKSTDKSAKILKKYKSDKVTILVNYENKGYASAINLGSKYLMQQLRNCYIIVSNADIVVKSEEDIKNLLKHFEIEDVAMVAPTINEWGVYKRCWKLCTTKETILCNIPLINRLYKHKFLEYPEGYFGTEYSVVDVIHGSFFIIDSAILKQVGFYDENTFLYYEENIMARKLQAIKKKSVVDNRIEVMHEHSVSINKSVNNVNKYRILKKSQEYYLKNYNGATKFQLRIIHILNKINEIGYKFR